MRRHTPVIAFAVLALCTVLPAWAELSADVLEMFRLGRYDDIIAKMDKQIEEAPTPDLLYARGAAAYELSEFDIAEADLSKLRDFAPVRTWQPASALVARIQKLKALTPQSVYDVKVGDTVAYRVCWDGASEWARAAIDALPEVHRAVCGLYDVSLPEIQLLVFADRAQFCAFYQEVYGRQPASREWVNGGPGRLLLCQLGSDGKPYATPGTDYFRREMAYRVARCSLGRYPGAGALPPWLYEGLAQVPASAETSNNIAVNNRRMADALGRNAVLPLAADLAVIGKRRRIAAPVVPAVNFCAVLGRGYRRCSSLANPLPAHIWDCVWT